MSEQGYVTMFPWELKLIYILVVRWVCQANFYVRNIKRYNHRGLFAGHRKKASK